MEFLLFDKYTTYIWASYLLTFATVAILFVSTKATHKRTIHPSGNFYQWALYLVLPQLENKNNCYYYRVLEIKGLPLVSHLRYGRFIATEVLAKHDENYMPPEVADALKQAKE
jgi:hypothetical protein